VLTRVFTVIGKSSYSS